MNDKIIASEYPEEFIWQQIQISKPKSLDNLKNIFDFTNEEVEVKYFFKLYNAVCRNTYFKRYSTTPIEPLSRYRYDIDMNDKKFDSVLKAGTRIVAHYLEQYIRYIDQGFCESRFYYFPERPF